MMIDMESESIVSQYIQVAFILWYLWWLNFVVEKNEDYDMKGVE